MECSHLLCPNAAEEGTDECYRHRLLSVGFNWRGGALIGKRGFHTTRNEYMTEHMGTTDDRELGRRGIERAT